MDPTLGLCWPQNWSQNWLISEIVLEPILSNFLTKFGVHFGVIFEMIRAQFVGPVLDSVSKPLGQHLETFLVSFGAVLAGRKAEQPTTKLEVSL